jgi:hypothetical protein
VCRCLTSRADPRGQLGSLPFVKQRDPLAPLHLHGRCFSQRERERGVERVNPTLNPTRSTPRSTPTLRSRSVVVAVLIQILYDFTIVLHQKTTSGVVHAPKSSAASIKEERTRRKTSRLSGLYQLTTRSLRRCISAFLRLSPRSFRYRSIKEILPLPVSHKTTLEST